MSFANLMVHVDPHSRSVGHVRIAVDLGQRFNAHLTGAATAEAWMMAGIDDTEFHRELAVEESHQIEKYFQQARQVFEAEVAAAGVNYAWRQRMGSAADFLKRQASAADLVLLGLPAIHPKAWPRTIVDLGEVVIRAGRPVLVIPEGNSLLKAERVVVAWKDTREARWAVFAALLFLVQAKKIIIVCCDDKKIDSDKSRDSLAGISEYLNYRNIPTQSHFRSGVEGSVADEIF